MNNKTEIQEHNCTIIAGYMNQEFDWMEDHNSLAPVIRKVWKDLERVGEDEARILYEHYFVEFFNCEHSVTRSRLCNAISYIRKYLKVYTFTVSSNIIWTSFDFGEVEAKSIEEARKLAIEKLTYDFTKANTALGTLDNTIGFTIEFNKDEVQVELKED